MKPGHRTGQLVAEVCGTGALVLAVIGSGIMAERLADGNAALALLCNTLATAATLLALGIALAPVTGAHLNPVVSLALALTGRFAWRSVPRFAAAQLSGAALGLLVAHAMFGLPLLAASRQARPGMALLLGEGVATCGLVLVVLRGDARRPLAVAVSVAAWIAGAYWFTSSTSFANPAVTLARSLSDTFTGIRPADVPGFVLGQLAGAAGAVVLAKGLTAGISEPPRGDGGQ